MRPIGAADPRFGGVQGDAAVRQFVAPLHAATAGFRKSMQKIVEKACANRALSP
jgi:hypothetical protein